MTGLGKSCRKRKLKEEEIQDSVRMRKHEYTKGLTDDLERDLVVAVQSSSVHACQSGYCRSIEFLAFVVASERQQFVSLEGQIGTDIQ